MDYIVDTLTKTPSQALVKSASSFGEEAAKIIGGYLDEGLRNVSEDISQSIRDGTKDISGTVKDVLLLFVDKFKETGIEGFTEWGICIERAFVHLGQKTETGVANAGYRLASSIDTVGEKAIVRIEETVRDSTRQITRELRTVGLKQIEHVKTTFSREITLAAIGFLIACFALLIIALTYAFSSGVIGFLIKECNIFSVVLAILNGYIAYTITNYASNTHADGASASQNSQNSNILVIVIGAIGFLIGSITKEIMYFGYLSTILTTLIMCFVTIGALKAFEMQLLGKVFELWKIVPEFLEWRRQQQQAQYDQQQQQQFNLLIGTLTQQAAAASASGDISSLPKLQITSTASGGAGTSSSRVRNNSLSVHSNGGSIVAITPPSSLSDNESNSSESRTIVSSSKRKVASSSTTIPTQTIGVASSMEDEQVAEQKLSKFSGTAEQGTSTGFPSSGALSDMTSSVVSIDSVASANANDEPDEHMVHDDAQAAQRAEAKSAAAAAAVVEQQQSAKQE